VVWKITSADRTPGVEANNSRRCRFLTLHVKFPTNRMYFSVLSDTTTGCLTCLGCFFLGRAKSTLIFLSFKGYIKIRIERETNNDVSKQGESESEIHFRWYLNLQLNWDCWELQKPPLLNPSLQMPTLCFYWHCTLKARKSSKKKIITNIATAVFV